MNKYKAWDSNRIAKVARWISKKHTLQQIAICLGISKQAVYKSIMRNKRLKDLWLLHRSSIRADIDRRKTSRKLKEEYNIKTISDFDILFIKSVPLERQKLLKKQFKHWRGAMRRARYRGIDCSIEFTDIFWPIYCPVFGYKLKYSSFYRQYDTPTLDRVDPNKGYTKGNVRVISWKANSLKNASRIKDLEKIIKYMKKHNCKTKFYYSSDLMYERFIHRLKKQAAGVLTGTNQPAMV